MKILKGVLCLIIILLILVYFSKPREYITKLVCWKDPPPTRDQQKLASAVVYRHANMVLSPTGFPTKTIQKIPKIIIQTNEKNAVPVDMYKSMKKLMDDNIDYEYIYFNNDDARKYLDENFNKKVLNAFDKVKPGAYKADLFRYCILYKMGGVYIDTPMVSKAPLDFLIDPLDEFISPEDNGTGGIYNAFICCTSGHPIIKKAMDMSIYNIENEIYGNDPHGDLSITGPILLRNAFKNVTGKRVRPGNYGNGIKIIKHNAYHINTICPGPTIGHITHNNVLLFVTRYPTYHIDREWYNTSKRYRDMWVERDVFNPSERKDVNPDDWETPKEYGLHT